MKSKKNDINIADECKRLSFHNITSERWNKT